MKYDKHHIDIIIKSLSEGDGRVRACKKAGIDYQTFLNWLKDEKKVDFFEAVKKAEDYGNDKIKDICKRRIIEDESWQSAAWWLERNYSEIYSLKQELKTKNINYDSKPLTKKEMKEIEDELENDY
jgi:hypothetical protein